MKQYIYGKNTILEALRGEKSVYTVYIQNNLKDNKIIELCKRKKYVLNWLISLNLSRN